MKNKLIIENLVFANKLASIFKRKIHFVNYDELQSAAYLGLVEAADNFDLEKGVSFESFAKFRIIGAIKDYLREISWGSRRFPLSVSQLAMDY